MSSKSDFNNNKEETIIKINWFKTEQAISKIFIIFFLISSIFLFGISFTLGIVWKIKDTILTTNHSLWLIIISGTGLLFVFFSLIVNLDKENGLLKQKIKIFENQIIMRKEKRIMKSTP